MSAASITPEFERQTYAKVAWKLIPFLFLCYIVAFLDRVNVGFAKLQMQGDLSFSDKIYGFGAGVFFVGYPAEGRFGPISRFVLGTGFTAERVAEALRA